MQKLAVWLIALATALGAAAQVAADADAPIVNPAIGPLIDIETSAIVVARSAAAR